MNYLTRIRYCVNACIEAYALSQDGTTEGLESTIKHLKGARADIDTALELLEAKLDENRR